jgi:hypothetical protein
MADIVFFDEAIYNIGNGAIDLDSHTFKAVLSNTSFADDAVDELADITQIANGSGYTTGGLTLATVTWAETGSGTGIWQWTVDDFSWTATGGSLVFRYIVIYDDTSTGDKLLCYIDVGTATTVPTGFIFTVDVGANGVFRIGPGVIS